MSAACKENVDDTQFDIDETLTAEELKQLVAAEADARASHSRASHSSSLHLKRAIDQADHYDQTAGSREDDRKRHRIHDHWPSSHSTALLTLPPTPQKPVEHPSNPSSLSPPPSDPVSTPPTPKATPRKGSRVDRDAVPAIIKPASTLQDTKPPSDLSLVAGVRRSDVFCMYAAACAMRKIPCGWRSALGLSKVVTDMYVKKEEIGKQRQLGDAVPASVELFGVDISVKKGDEWEDVNAIGDGNAPIDCLKVEWHLRQAFGARFRDVKQALLHIVAAIPLPVLEIRHESLLNLFFTQRTLSTDILWEDKGVLDLRALIKITETFLQTDGEKRDR
ncbi:hypothetical protein HDU67_000069 [Dinochytrium kinnereticum]|nr:hypothetical protein HDU67_000069 [Dinochytrium kinnereticum]